MAWVNIEDLVAQNRPSHKEVQQVLDYLSRKAEARFLSDENFPEPAVTLLRAMGGKVQTTDANGLVLVTCDCDFLDERRFPLIHCPTIFVFDFGVGSRQEMKKSFRCLSGVFRAPQFYDKWCKVDAKRDCWTGIVRHGRHQAVLLHR
jgi:hypothetical protein